MANANGPVYLDLDAIENEVEIVVKLNGKEHALQPITVDDFIYNTKLVQDLGTNPDFEKETMTIIKMLIRAFPTMTEEELRKLPLVKLNAILDFAQKHNGSKQVEESMAEEAKEVENPPTAGA